MEQAKNNGPTIDDLFPIDKNLSEEELEKSLPKPDVSPYTRINLLVARDAHIAEQLPEYQEEDGISTIK